MRFENVDLGTSGPGQAIKRHRAMIRESVFQMARQYRFGSTQADRDEAREALIEMLGPETAEFIMSSPTS